MRIFRASLVCFILFASFHSVSRADAPRPTIHVFDLRTTSSMTTAQRWDIYHASICLQGLANRQVPRIFLIHDNYQVVWLNRLVESGGLCEGWSVVYMADFAELLASYRDLVEGVVAYDPDPDTGVISTSLAATTAAGVENALAVRKDTTAGSLYRYLVIDANGPGLPVLVDLTGKFTGSGTIWQTTTPSTGSAKCDAYIWAKNIYLDAGQCDPTVLSYSLDLWGLKYIQRTYSLSNLDFAVARRGFCFELSPWGDEIPNDDPTQPLGTDLNTYKAILDACNTQTRKGAMIKFCGFPNIGYKYTSMVGGQHDPVPTEWETVRLISAYNAYMEVFWTYNTSFYAGLRPVMDERPFVQNPPPTYEQMVSRGLIGANNQVVPGNYIMVGMGDYDCVSWTLEHLAVDRYADAARGQIYATWAVDPNLADRIAPAIDYMYRHKTEKDYFVAWDSGAGYINPGQLYGNRSPAGYPSGVAVWQTHCREYYRLLDYSISAWLLNGYMGSTGTTDFQTYQPFSGDGIGLWGSTTNITLYNNIPIKNANGDLENADSPIIDYATGVNFAWYRAILWYPSALQQLENNWAASGHNHRFLDAYTFYYLMRHHLGGNNNHRATWVEDTIPRVMTAGQSYPVSVTVRNDGWDTWSEENYYRLSHAWLPVGSPADKLMVVDNDGLHGTQERSGSIHLFAGKHPIEVTYFERTGSAVLEVRYEGPGITKQLIPDSALFRRTDPATAGVNYAYYHGTWSNLPNFDSLTPVKTGTLNNFSLSPAERGDYFGFKFTAYVQVPTDGIYTFYTTSDDGSRLYIGGTEFNPRHTLPSATTIAPGQSHTFTFNVTAPTTLGRYSLYYDMVHDLVTWFRWVNNIEGRKEIIVATDENEVDTDADGLPDVFEQANGLLYWHPDDGLLAKATQLTPANGDRHVDPNADLVWTAGIGATAHRVYFGMDNPPPLVAQQAETSWDPGTMDKNQTYYWRIDEVTSFGIVPGEDWSFMIAGDPGDLDRDGDVDLEDFGYLQACYSGSGILPGQGCTDADLDRDNDVDQADFVIFKNNLRGPGRTPGG